MLILLVSCTPDPSGTGDDDDDAPVDTDDTDDTGTPTEPPSPADVVSASCVPDPDNALRAICTVTLSDPSPVDLSITDGTESAVFSSPADDVDHTVPLWGLTAETEWTFTAAAPAGGATLDGAFTTGALPPQMQFDAGLTGASTLAHLMLPLSCDDEGWVVAWDALGRPRWYHDYPKNDGGALDAFEFTEADTVLGMVGRRFVAEVDLAGNELLFADDFPIPLHHDLTRKAGRIWVVMADAYPASDGRTYVEDLIVTLDDDGNIVDRWEEHDHLDATRSTSGIGNFWSNEFPGAIDAWHTNGLFVEDDGSFIVSLDKEHTLMRVSGGIVDWFLAGDGVGDAFPTDIALVPDGGDPRFGAEHHPRLLPNGHLTVFDNGGRPDPRGLELDLDQVANTATFVAEWPMPGMHCPNQSSVFDLPNGHHVVTCAGEHVVIEYDVGNVEVARFVPTCQGRRSFPMTIRGQPMDLWSATAAGVTAARGTARRAR